MVFSSCESGLQHAVPGSQYGGWLAAGLKAGASEMLLSLWKIDAGSAARFMDVFYERWVEGASVGEAARGGGSGRVSLAENALRRRSGGGRG